MRTIKFRGKSLHTSKWYYGDLIQPSDNVCFIQPRGTAGILCDIKTVGQFTGLTDKNARDIYEGDIVVWKDSDTNERKDVVTWVSGGLCLCNSKYTVGDYGGLEVIGNIYDNPDLLTQE